jgi:hypothetical protein
MAVLLSRQGDGASFGLCKRCYGLIVADHESEDDIKEWLVDRFVLWVCAFD